MKRDKAKAIAHWVDNDEKKAIGNLVDFARDYADQTEKDYEVLREHFRE